MHMSIVKLYCFKVYTIRFNNELKKRKDNVSLKAKKALKMAYFKFTSTYLKFYNTNQ